MAFCIRLECSSSFADSFSLPCKVIRCRRHIITFRLCSCHSSEASCMKGLNFSKALFMKAASRQQISRKASQRSCEKYSLMLPSNSMSRSPSFFDLSIAGTYLIRNSQRRLMRSVCMSAGSSLLRRVLREQRESSVESHYLSCEWRSFCWRSKRSRYCSRMRSSFLAILEWLLPVVPLSSNRKISSKQRVSLPLYSCAPMSPTSSSIRLQLNNSKAGMYSTQWHSVSRQRVIRRNRQQPSSCRHRHRCLRMLRIQCSRVSLNCCVSAEETSPSDPPKPSLSSILRMVRLLSTFAGTASSSSDSRLSTNTPKSSFHSSRSNSTRASLQLCRSPWGSPSIRHLCMPWITYSLKEALRLRSNVAHSPLILLVRTLWTYRRVQLWRAYAWMAEKDSKKCWMECMARREKMEFWALAISEEEGAAKERSRMSMSLGQRMVPSLRRSKRHWTSRRKGRSMGALLYII